MTTGPPIARPRTLAGLGVCWRAASPTKIACSIIVAPRPPYSLGQEIPAHPASWSLRCHSRRKAITSSSPLSGSGPGLFSSIQVRTSSRKDSSDGDSVRSIAAQHIGGTGRAASPPPRAKPFFSPDPHAGGARFFVRFFEGVGFAQRLRVIFGFFEVFFCRIHDRFGFVVGEAESPDFVELRLDSRDHDGFDRFFLELFRRRLLFAEAFFFSKFF